MAKVVDITEKLSFDENPVLKIKDIEVEVKSGDVAIVDLEKSVTDRYYVGFNRIN